MSRRPTLDACCIICKTHLPERDSICLATPQCVDRYVEHCAKHSPGMAKANALDPDGFRESILRNHQQKGTTAMAAKSTPSKPKADKAPKAPTYCRFSGEQTGGGKFLPGRDASLHGVLIRQSQAGNVDALVELICYGWSLPEGIEPAVESSARAKMKGLDQDEYTQSRADARLAKFKGGASLEDVYGDELKRQPKPRKPKAEKAPAKAKPAAKAAKKSTGKRPLKAVG